jgi:hypothetical protein
MLLGIQAGATVRLSEIARRLEEPIRLKKTVERLSRNLKREGLGRAVAASVLREGARLIGEDTLLIVDTGDLVKKYARKMEHLAVVRDGSEGKLARGYWTCEVVGAECGRSEVVPLYHELYSSQAEGFVSENEELLKAIGGVREATAGRGVYVMDRGGDRKVLYRELVSDEGGVRFIVRQRGDRQVLYRGRRVPMLQLAQGCRTGYGAVVVNEGQHREKSYRIEVGALSVRLPEHPAVRLSLVVVKGFGETPLMLLTNVVLPRRRKKMWWVVEAYLTRWRVEETIRFVKQSYQEEDVRVLTYVRLRNLAALVLAASFFAAVHLGRSVKLQVLTLHALKAAKRLFGIPDFRYYAVADGIRAILTRHGRGTLYPRGHAPPQPQPSLFAPEFLG